MQRYFTRNISIVFKYRHRLAGIIKVMAAILMIWAGLVTRFGEPGRAFLDYVSGESKMSKGTLGSTDKRHFFKTIFREVPGTFELDDEQLKNLQSLLLDMLKDFIEVFEEEGIFYTLSGGSVLGAIRHQGFIPWDDDIDINMPRRDFEHLKEIFDEKLGDKYVLCAPEIGRGYGMSHVQIKKKNTVFKALNELKMKDIGIYIDIFVLENTYDNAFLRKLHGYRCLFWGYALTCKKTANEYDALLPYIGYVDALKKAYRKKMIIGKLFFFISLDALSKKVMKLYSRCRDDNTKYVCIPSGRKHYFGEMYLRSDMNESKEATFENLKVRIPKGTDKYMHVLYGDGYMEIPPVGDREIHSIIEFKL